MKPGLRAKLTPKKPTKIHKLQLCNARLKILPPEIENFENLKYLDLFNNNLEFLPEYFFKLSKLVALSLNGNKFSSLPSMVFLLPELKSFSIKDNKISIISRDKFENLFKIKKVDLSHNQIESLPFENSFINISYDLEDFSIAGNKLTEFPQCLMNASSLEFLDISVNCIKDIDEDAFDKLVNLKYLDLSSNELTSLPSSIGMLTKLEHLNLSNNFIKSLPKEFENLTSLKSLQFSANPIGQVPLEIKAQGTQGIINYYLSLGENIQLFEAKLLIVGQGGVGKTYLMNKIISGVSEDTVTTEGIEIKSWEIETQSVEDFRVNIWDFGGQEIYHSTHQFFLTKRSLYLFIWEARKDEHLINFDYWLNIIKLLSNESPVIIVLNKIDERIKSIDEKSLKDKFKNIISFHQVSAKTGQNIDGLINSIKREIDSLPLIGDKLPKVWLDIREDLEHLEDNYIEYKDYLVICNKWGIGDKRSLYLSRYFHDLGVFLHFQDNPLLRNIIFLKPEWATNAVYKIIDTKSIIKNYGEFSFSDLDQILTDYPKDKYIHLIELMKKFELCFPLNEKEYIVPELLKPEKIAFDWDYSDNLKFEYHYDFMPAGVLARFIVRVKDMVPNKTYWKNGVVVSREETYALVISDQYSRNIKIWVNGDNRAFLLEIIRRELDQIHESLNYPYVLEKVPCICPVCKESVDPHLFNYTFIKKIRLNNAFRTIPCEKSLRGVDTQKLLGAYAISSLNKSEITRFNSDDLLFALIDKAGRLIERKYTKRIEDLINDDFTDYLRDNGYYVTDQTRSGTSGGSANNAGELDLMIRNHNHSPLTIIEGFRLMSCGEKNKVVASHINKLLNYYDTNGLKRNFVLIFGEANNFGDLWSNYVSYINNINANDLFLSNYPLSGFSVRKDLSNRSGIKVGIARHERDGEEVEVVHIMMNLFNKIKK